MNRMAIRRTPVAVTAGCFLLLLVLVLPTHAKREHKEGDILGHEDIEAGVLLPNRWRFHPGDSSDWAKSDYDDAGWKPASTYLVKEDLPEGGWPGSGWFRTTIAIDSTLHNTTISLSFGFHSGASEIYLDGELLRKNGTVGESRDSEVFHWERNPIPLMLDEKPNHTIAVRFSNYRPEIFHWTKFPAGFSVRLGNLRQAIDARVDESRDSTLAGFLMGGIPCLVAVLHVMLFAFYPKSRENLYYAVFATLLASFFIAGGLMSFLEPVPYIYVAFLTNVTLDLAFYAALRFVYSINYERVPWQFWPLLAYGLGAGVWQLWTTESLPGLIGMGVVLLEMARVLIRAVWMKKEDSWLIAVGMGAMILQVGLISLGTLWITISIPPFAGFAILLISMSIYVARCVGRTSRQKEFVQRAFGQYLSPAVVEHIVTNPEMIDQLGGEERVMTAFFSDIASFSTISERLTPTELVHFINDYLTEMCEIIERYEGTVDKFEGDAIVAFSGAPVSIEDHAVRSALSCIDQQKKLEELRDRWHIERSLPPALQTLREEWEAEGRVFTHVRMGAAAGPMVVGNMGSRNRTDYTMMGDTVNLAARLESIQKLYGTNIMVNGLINEHIQDQVETRWVDQIQVVGKEEAVAVYEIIDRKGDVSTRMSEVLGSWNDGMAAYKDYQFTSAQKHFEAALRAEPSDGPTKLYVERCKVFSLDPPEDLIYRATSK
jgi:class 3 adenylate cyclase